MSLRRISDIHQMPVLDLETGEILGQVLRWVVSPQQQRVMAYVLAQPTLWKKAQIVVPNDIVEYGPRMIVVRDNQSVITPSEVVGLPDLIQSECSVTGFKAETESGQPLGTIVDFVIDVVSSRIQQYYIKPQTLTGMLQGDWIMPAGKVVRIEGRKLIFPDNIVAGTKIPSQRQSQTI